MNSFYLIRVWPSERDRINPALDLYLDQGELYLSPTMNLCSHSAMAHVESQALAEQFKTFALPRIQERYGIESRLELCAVEMSGTENQLRKIADRIGADSEKVRHVLNNRRVARASRKKTVTTPVLAAVTLH